MVPNFMYQIELFGDEPPIPNDRSRTRVSQQSTCRFTRFGQVWTRIVVCTKETDSATAHVSIVNGDAEDSVTELRFSNRTIMREFASSLWHRKFCSSGPESPVSRYNTSGGRFPLLGSYSPLFLQIFRNFNSFRSIGIGSWIYSWSEFSVWGIQTLDIRYNKCSDVLLFHTAVWVTRNTQNFKI